MGTLNELFEQEDFIVGSHAKRVDLFNVWKQDNLVPFVATLPDTTEKLNAQREVEDYFNAVVPAPERESYLDDAGTAVSASVDQLQVLGGEVAAQLTATDPSGLEAWALQEEAKGTPESAANAARIRERAGELQGRTDSIQTFIDDNVAEGEDTRQQFSDYTKDKQRELQEMMDAAPTDAGKAGAAVDFYLTAENIDMLGLLTLESAAPTAAVIGTTVVGGLVGGPLGAATAATVAEGALGAGEASAGAYQKALAELKKQGVPEDEAKLQAREASRTAAAIGGVASAALGSFGEALPILRTFGKAAGDAPVKGNEVLDAGVSVAGGVAGEFAQGASVQVAENIAVDPITPTGTFDGAITAGTLEALAATPTVAGTQALSALVSHAIDSADEIMQADSTRTELEEQLDAQKDADESTPEIEIDTSDDTGTVDSSGSDLPTPPTASTADDTPPADTGTTTGDTGITETTPPEVPVPEQPTSAGTPDVTGAAPEAPAATDGGGNGTAVPPVPETDTGSDGGGSVTDAGGDGATGQQGGDSTAEVVEPDTASGLQEDQPITELEDFVPEDTTPESEWREYELDVPFTALDNDLQTIWKDQVANFQEDPTFPLQPQADAIMMQYNSRQRDTARTQPAVRRTIPESVAQYMQTGQTEDAAALEYARTAPLPIVLTSTERKSPLPANIKIAEGKGLDGVAGVLNAAVQRSGAESGTYLIVEPAASVAHVMTNKGVKVKTVPFKETAAAGTTAQVTGPSGAVNYERLQVKRGNAKVRRQANGVSAYEGMLLPTELDSTLKPKGAKFSGSVYVVRPDVEAVTTVTPPAQTVIVPAFDSPLPGSVVNTIMNNSTAIQHMPVQDVIDAVLADSDIANYPQYQRMLTNLRPFVGSYSLGHDTVLGNSLSVMGYHSGSESLIMIKDGDGMSYHTLTHEIAHAATVASFKKRSARTEPVWQQIIAAYDLLSDVPNFDAYGFTNPKEFVAEIYTNPHFRSALDAVQGVVPNKTLWDHVRDLIAGKLFDIDTEYNAQQLVDWTESLFETNESLHTDGYIPLGERGRTWADKIKGRYSDDLTTTWTRSGLARAARRARFAIRRTIMDDTTPFLKFLNLETQLPTQTADYDTYKSWTLFNTAGNVKRQIVRKFTANHFRKIEAASKALYQRTKGNGLSAAEVMEQAALYATASHIPNATRVQRNRELADIAEAQVVVADIDARLNAGEPVPAEEEIAARSALDKAEGRLRTFDLVQRGELYDANGDYTGIYELAKANPWTVQGGATAKEAIRIQADIIRALSQPNPADASIRTDLEAIQQMYIEANREIWQRLIREGEVSPEQAKAHADSGLDRDYIPFTGLTTLEGRALQYHQAFGIRGSVSAPVERRREGRLDPPEDAYASLQRNLDNMASRISTRPFRQQLLADIQSGLIPKAKAGWNLLKGKSQYRPTPPKGVQPLYLRTNDGTYEFWLQSEDDNQNWTVMTALNGISGQHEAPFGTEVIGRTTRAYSMMFTYATPAFAPINFFRETQENMFNINARDLTWTDDKGVERSIDRKKLAINVATSAADPQLFADTLRIYTNRGFSNTPTQSEAHLAKSRLGKKFLEAESYGAINVEIDSVLAMYQNQDMSSADKQALRKLTNYMGEMQAEATKEGGVKLSVAQTKALISQLRGISAEGLDVAYATLSLWNRMWDVRAKVAVYDALTLQGMPRELAAARTLDLANYNKQGSVGKYFTAISPFYRSKVFGAANLIRSMGTKQGATTMVGMIAMFAMLDIISRLLAGDDEEDPLFTYNKQDAVPPLTKRGNLTFVLPGKDGLSDRVAKLPVGYGGPRIAHTSAVQAVRKLFDSPLDTKEHGLSEVYKVILDEALPLPLQPESVDANTIFDYLTLSFTPVMLQGSVATSLNINQFGSPVDYIVDPDKPGYSQGYFRTPEVWTDVAQRLYESTDGGWNWTPQQTRGHLSWLFPGPLSGIPAELTQGDRDVKGLPFGAGDELGLYNMLGMSRLYGRVSPPEERTAYQLANEFRQQRSKYATFKEVLPPKKRLRSGKMSKAKQTVKGEWVWDTDKLTRDNKLYMIQQHESVEAFNKALTGIKREVNAKDKQIRLAENQARKATGDEGYAFGTSQEALNAEREFWDTKYLEQRQLFKQFIINFSAAQRVGQ